MWCVIDVSQEMVLLEGSNGPFGPCLFMFSPDELTLEQRAELAKSKKTNLSRRECVELPDYYINEKNSFHAGNYRIDLPAVAHADQETLVKLLDTRIKLRREMEQEIERKELERGAAMLAKELAQVKLLTDATDEELIRFYSDSKFDCHTLRDGEESVNKPTAFELVKKYDEKFPTYRLKARMVGAQIIAKQRADELAARLAEEAEQEAQREQAKQEELVAWIKLYGSDRLKIMLEEGFSLQKTYEEERAKKELPDYLICTDPDLKPRANPSAAGLEELTRLRALGYERTSNGQNYYAQLCWGTRADDEDRPGEIIAVRTPWCRYYLCLFIGPVESDDE